MLGIYIFGVLSVDIVVPVAATEGWNIWFELCDGEYQSHYILMTLCDDCPTANKGQYEWDFCKLLYLRLPSSLGVIRMSKRA